MTTTWPSDIGSGKLTWWIGSMSADNWDEDRDPQLSPYAGMVVDFKPDVDIPLRYSGLAGHRTIMPESSQGILDDDGYLCTMNEDGTAGERGVILPATDSETLTPVNWTYSVIVDNTRLKIPRFSIDVPSDSVRDLAPIATVAATSGDMIIIDGNTADRIEAAATNAATSEANAAQSATASATSASVSTTAATTATTAADEAKTARDETLAHGISLDTSVGTRIFVGDTMIHGETGIRVIEAAAMSSGRLTISREGKYVHLVLDDAVLTDSGLGWVEFPRIPLGFRPGIRRVRDVWLAGETGDAGGSIGISAAGYLSVYNANPTQPVYFSTIYETNQAWPTSLPGTSL